MNAYVTNNNIATEYDGVVVSQGIVGLIGIGSLTFGVALGLDYLMDKNHKYWIYPAALKLVFSWLENPEVYGRYLKRIVKTAISKLGFTKLIVLSVAELMAFRSIVNVANVSATHSV